MGYLSKPREGKGEIALFGADFFTAGALVGKCDIPSSTLTPSTLGTRVAWSGTSSMYIGAEPGVLFNTAGPDAFDQANPVGIYVPPGATFASFTASLQFPEPETPLGGQRWLRLIKAVSDSHFSNVIVNAHGLVSMPQTLNLNTGWIPVLAGSLFCLHAAQNSGETITLAGGNVGNFGASTFFRAAFK